MAKWTPDPTFYPSPKMAMEGPPETLAYVVALDPTRKVPDALTVVDVDRSSKSYARVVGQLDMPHVGDELHHFGWNACSAALCPWAPHPHIERRYLVVPGLRSSRIHIIDTKSNPRQPTLEKVIEPAEVMSRAGYSRVHTIHCGPDGIYVSALGSPDGGGPGGIFILDHYNFNVLGRWEIDRGPQELAYDFWWHLGHDTLVTSEWGTPRMVEEGLQPELLLNAKYGHRMHIWDLRRRRHQQVLDLGEKNQMVLELRPAHDPTKTFGFVGVVISIEDLSGSIWTWFRDQDGSWKIKKTISIPAEPAEPDQLPPLLKGFKAVPPLITDISLSLDDRYLYVACWGTGELRQYDVSDPLNPQQTGSVRIGGIAKRDPHPSKPSQPLNGGPQMVEASRDGRRVYFTNSLYASWDAQFYPDGIDGWMVRVDVAPEGGMRLAPDFFVEFGDLRAHQIRLEGGDASSDSYCYP